MSFFIHSTQNEYFYKFTTSTSQFFSHLYLNRPLLQFHSTVLLRIVLTVIQDGIHVYTMLASRLMQGVLDGICVYVRARVALVCVCARVALVCCVCACVLALIYVCLRVCAFGMQTQSIVDCNNSGMSVSRYT